MYTVKEIFYTLQGEGVHAGRAAVFCRFAGCNLWSGREVDRAKSICRFCDTDFVGVGPDGGRFACSAALADQICRQWQGLGGTPYVVFTGGEPLLQLDEALIAALHERGFEVGVETNGTLAAPDGIDWLCVSPKAGADWVQRHGDEIKLVYPQTGLLPHDVDTTGFAHAWLQPMDDCARAGNTAAAIDYCMRAPHWRLSLQGHKLVGIR
ncbi:7-carboxy-7-deazaguanine synthase [Craterilacuibacter sinensis]|uniref:7-carboxy-7-deazaguanine synthase n=1 Tax=Craterilacuibacter sinensis TaxID=2686017 RepID=A0A845BJQ7_9NEIS|nr:7-carboxy-7-deazaguanine synthase [Craterilacuibacter sinensis]MXR36947.1 7-carboxy-7-deazaguanine synthase [Craterilacuibacter sinensis]